MPQMIRALAVIDSLSLGQEPGLVEAARDGVDLDAEGRQREGMDHVLAEVTCMRTTVPTGTTTSLSTASRRGWRRRFSGRAGRRSACCRSRSRRLVGIFIGPVPLVAGDLDGHVGLRNVELEDEQARRTVRR